MLCVMAQGGPIGNEFWKLRSKHGVDANFTDAHKLWESACEYFQWCMNNPLMSVEYNGKDAIECKVPKMRAFTYQGLSLFLGTNSKWFTEFKHTETAKKNDFPEIIARIDDVIYMQKFEGAAANMLNPNIIARDLGLAERNVTDQNMTVSEETIKAIADKLNA